MPVKIACPKCSKNYTLPDSAVGKAVKCKECGTAFRTRMPDATAQPTAPAKPVARPAQTARPAKPGARPASPGARPAPAKPAQPVSPDLGQFGVEGGFQAQADIFGAPPSPRGGAGLGNFAEDGLGEAVAPIVLGPEGGAEPVQVNPYQSVMTNRSLERGRAKTGLKRKSGSFGASFDPDRYSVARIGMMIVLGAGAILMMASVFSLVLSVAVRLMPEQVVLNLAYAIGIVSLIIGLLCLVALMCVALGQLICVFAPESNEKVNAGGSIGLFFLSVFGGFVGLRVIWASVASFSQTGRMGGVPSQAEIAVLGVGTLVIVGVCALLGLASFVLFANYYRVIGKNIKSKELISAGNKGLAAIGLGVGGQLALFIVVFVIGYLSFDRDTLLFLLGAVVFCRGLLGLVVYGLMLRMVMVGVRVLKG